MESRAIDAVVARAQGGDREAFRTLVLELQGAVRLALIWSAPSTDVLEEVVQGTFVTAFHRLGDYRLEGTFQAWLKGIARNLLARELQSRRRLVHLEGDALERELLAAPQLDGDGDGDDALAALRACLDALAPRARALIDRRYGDGQALAEMATRFHQPKGTLAVALYRIREELRRCLDGKGISA